MKKLLGLWVLLGLCLGGNQAIAKPELSAEWTYNVESAGVPVQRGLRCGRYQFRGDFGAGRLVRTFCCAWLRR